MIIKNELTVWDIAILCSYTASSSANQATQARLDSTTAAAWNLWIDKDEINKS